MAFSYSQLARPSLPFCTALCTNCKLLKIKGTLLKNY